MKIVHYSLHRTSVEYFSKAAIKSELEGMYLGFTKWTGFETIV